MGNGEMRRIEIKGILQKLIREATDKFVAGEQTAAWERIKSYPDGGKIVGVIYPNQNGVDINYVCSALPYGDLGVTIGTINFDLVRIDTVVFLTACMIDSYESD